jgi:NADH-quinone oxidoreductase subunit N
MGNKILPGLSTVVFLHSFTVFPEYLLSVSLLYVLIVVSLITYSVYGLMVQKAVSECIALTLVMACYLIFNDDLLALNFTIFNQSIINDYFAFLTKLIICFSSAVYFFIIADSLKEQKLTSFEYLLITLFAVLGLILMCCSNDLLTAYLAIELSSLAFYLLASFKKTSSYSVEGGVKYFITGAVSSAFFLLGSSLIYGITGSINFSDFSCLFEQSSLYEFPYYLSDTEIPIEALADYVYYLWWIMTHAPEPSDFFNYNFVEIGLTLILFSLFIKLALAPFHLWSLDVYEGSPTSSTFFFAVISKLSIFVLLVRLCYSSFFSLNESWQFYSLWVGVLSIFTSRSSIIFSGEYPSLNHIRNLLLASNSFLEE